MPCWLVVLLFAMLGIKKHSSSCRKKALFVRKLHTLYLAESLLAKKAAKVKYTFVDVQNIFIDTRI